MLPTLIGALVMLAAACFYGVRTSRALSLADTRANVLTLERDNFEARAEYAEAETERLYFELIREITQNWNHVAAIELLDSELARRDAKVRTLRAIKAGA